MGGRGDRHQRERGSRPSLLRSARPSCGLPAVSTRANGTRCSHRMRGHGTVLLPDHVGSRERRRRPARAPPAYPVPCYSAASGCTARFDWLTRRLPVAVPRHSLCLFRRRHRLGAGILDRLDHCYRYKTGVLPTLAAATVDESPSECCGANFLVRRCSTTTRAARARVHRRGFTSRRSDYPHADSSWPDTPALLVGSFATGVPDGDDGRRITWTENASELFRHRFPHALAAVTTPRPPPALVARHAREIPTSSAVIEAAASGCLVSITWSE